MPTVLSRLSRCAATLAAVAGCLGGALTALPAALPAAPAAAAPLSTKTFTYADMPDIDQKRQVGVDAAGVNHAGLGQNGINYCGPAAAMDALAFLADHGAASMSPGSHDWTAAGNYETMTAKLSELGTMMGTNPATGTSLGGFQNGLLSWNNKYGYNGHHFGLVSEFSSDDNDWQAPNLGIAAFAEAVGNPIIVSIGYYTPTEVSANGHEIIGLRRTGGHFVAMTGFDNSGFNFMDPADAGPSFTQSAYANQAQPVTPVTAVFTDSGGNPYRSDLQTETFLKMPGYAGGTAYIEGYTVLQPTFTLTAKRSLLILRRFDSVLKIKTPVLGKVADAQLSPAGDSAYFAMAGGKTVYKLNLATKVTTPLAKASAPVTSLAVNTQGDTIYTAAGRQVAAVSNTGTTIAKTTLPAAAAAITYDPVRGQVDVVTPQAKAVQVLAPSLQTQGTVILPAAAVANATTVSASVDSITGQLTIKAPGIASTVVSAPLPAPAPVAPVASTIPADATVVAAAQAPIAATQVAAATVTPPVPDTSVASLADAPVVKVTPVAGPVSKITTPLLVHGAVIRTTTPATAPSTIVRTPQNVLASGVWADQMAG